MTKSTTVIHSIFGGYLRSQVHCLSCKHDSNTFDPFLDLNLEVRNFVTIEKALHHFTASERLDADNLYLCSNCGKRVIAERRLTIRTAPPVLTLQLKRFDFSK